MYTNTNLAYCEKDKALLMSTQSTTNLGMGERAVLNARCDLVETWLPEETAEIKGKLQNNWGDYLSSMFGGVS